MGVPIQVWRVGIGGFMPKSQTSKSGGHVGAYIGLCRTASRVGHAGVPAGLGLLCFRAGIVCALLLLASGIEPNPAPAPAPAPAHQHYIACNRPPRHASAPTRHNKRPDCDGRNPQPQHRRAVYAIDHRLTTTNVQCVLR